MLTRIMAALFAVSSAVLALYAFGSPPALAATVSAAKPAPSAAGCESELSRYKEALPLYKSELAEAKRILLDTCRYARGNGYRSPVCDDVIAGVRCSEGYKCAIP